MEDKKISELDYFEVQVQLQILEHNVDKLPGNLALQRELEERESASSWRNWNARRRVSIRTRGTSSLIDVGVGGFLEASYGNHAKSHDRPCA